MAKQVLTGLVGWRGMVGSVLLERMRAEGDFALIEPVFFSTSNAGGAAPAEAKNETQALRRLRHRRAEALRDRHHRAGRRVHQEGLPRAARGGLEGLLDRRGQDAAHAGRRGHHPRPGQPATSSRTRWQAWRARLHRRQLHGQLHADGRGRAVQGRPGRVDDLHDLPGRLRRRRAAHARTADAVRHAERGGARRCSTTRPRRSSRSTARWSQTQRGAVGATRSPTSACRWAAA